MFRIEDVENKTLLPDEFKSKSEARRYIATKKLDEKLFLVQEASDGERDEEAEAQTDNEVATRTSRFDQDLKERARVVGINPDNYEEEHILGEAVKKAEEAREQEATDEA